MPWRWYVYEIERIGQIIYVGKGCSNRCRQSAKQRGGRPIIIAHFEHEAAALAFERARIKERLAQGCNLQNISHGNKASWWKRTDSRQMAKEALHEIACRIDSWVKAGRLDELVKMMRCPKEQLLDVHSRWLRFDCFDS